MFSAFERLVAFRYLRSKKQDGFISVIAWFSFLGIMLGVATLIIVMSVMNGFRSELTAQILGFQSHITLSPSKNNHEAIRYAKNQEIIRALPGVTKVIPVIERQTILNTGSRAFGSMLIGLSPDDFHLNDKIISGSLDAFAEQSIIIGVKMAEKLGVNISDKVRVIFPQGMNTPFGSAPKIVKFTVAAIFEVGMYQFDDTVVFVTKDDAQKFFNVKDGIDSLHIYLEDPYKVKHTADILRDKFYSSYRISDWMSSNKPMINALEVERNVMFIILTLIILVATFNVISSMIMLVKDKGRDIAILRTMGASKNSILRIFFLTGSSIGVAGTIAGLIFGVAFAQNIEKIRYVLEKFSGVALFDEQIYFFSHLPSKLEVYDVVQIVILSLSLSFIATILPAWKAAKLDPVEALRYE